MQNGCRKRELRVHGGHVDVVADAVTLHPIALLHLAFLDPCVEDRLREAELERPSSWELHWVSMPFNEGCQRRLLVIFHRHALAVSEPFPQQGAGSLDMEHLPSVEDHDAPVEVGMNGLGLGHAMGRCKGV